MTALIFDLDGVVADTAAAHTRSWQRFAAKEGLSFGSAEQRAVRGRTRSDSLDILIKQRPMSFEKREEYLARKQGYFSLELAEMGPGDALPGVRRLLREARAKLIPTGLASSSSNAHAVLERLELSDQFDFIADASSVANPKPAPDIFLLTASRLKIPPQRCLVLEDSVAGVEGALAAGCAVVGLGGVAAPHELTDLARTSLSDLLALIDTNSALGWRGATASEQF